MKHNYLKDDCSGDHWSVGLNATKRPGSSAEILVQVQQAGEQVRIPLSVEQAEAFVAELTRKLAEAKAANSQG